MPCLVLTLIGNDRPGLVARVAATIQAHNGNWLESSLAQLAGKFAGIINITVPADNLDALKQALTDLTDLRVMMEVAEATLEAPICILRLSLTGNDRPGIVQEVTEVLAHHRVNVEEFSSHTSSAPMSGDLLFHATARLSAGKNVGLATLHVALENLSQELIVELTQDD